MRYGEVDLQRVIFNAHYLAYVDDAMDHWMRTLDTSFESLGWDFMLKRAELEWDGPAGLGDHGTRKNRRRFGPTFREFGGKSGDHSVGVIRGLLVSFCEDQGEGQIKALQPFDELEVNRLRVKPRVDEHKEAN